MRPDHLTVLTTTGEVHRYWLSKRGDWYWSGDGTRLLVCPFGRAGRKYEHPRPLVLKVVAGRECSYSRNAGSGSGLDGRPAALIPQRRGDSFDQVDDVTLIATGGELAASAVA